MGLLNLFKNKDDSKPIGQQLETATYESPYYPDSQLAPYNPDSLVGEKGLEIFDSMESDDQVRASFMLKKLMITSRNWDIEPIDDSSQAKEQADFIYYSFTDGFDGVFKDFFHGMLSALQYGFSINEKTYKVFKDGQYKDKIGIKSLKSRPPHSFKFHIDEFGNLTYLLQHQPKGDAKLDYNKFVIFSYDMKFGNFYGRSDFKSAYRSWFSKDIIIRFWNMYLERNGMPITIGKYKPGLSSKEKLNFKNILRKFTANTVMTIPKDLEVEFLEAKNGAIKYETAIDKHNTMIARSFLIPELIGFTDHKSGSQSLGKEQFDLFYKILEDIQKNLEDLINEGLVKELINYNFANVTEYPKFRFSPIDTRTKDNLYKIWYDAVKIGAVLTTKDDEAYLRNEIGLPERKDDSENIMPISQPTNIPETIPDDDIEGKEPIKDKEELAEKTFSRAETEYEKQVSLTEISNDLDSLALDFAEDLGVILEEIENSLLMQIKRKKIIEKKDFSAINTVGINKAEKKQLGNAFLKNNKKIFSSAYSTSMADIKKHINTLVEIDTSGALIPAEALEYLASKSIKITGDETDFIKKKVQDILYVGLKTGKSESAIMYELSIFFDQYTVFQATGTGDLLDITEITGRINTIIRTNLSDAYNQGRVASYNDENVSDFIEALQYSAILDQRTTEFCRKYDKRIYEKNDQIWDSLIPPNHYNCRSLTIPVFAGDKYEEDKRLAIQQPLNFGGTPS